jgi:peptide deformylase
VGLAAIQIGEALNVLIIKHEDELIEAINPKIIQSTGVQYKTEGSLSIPGVSGIVERASSVEVEYIDRDGDKCSMVASDALATIWQHLMENLQGGLYIDNLPKGKLKRVKATYNKVNKES